MRKKPGLGKLVLLFSALSAALVLISPSPVAGAGQEGLLNRLFAPGPLILGHKNLEGRECLQCHDAGKGVPDSKCLACHKEFATAVKTKKGFHGMTDKTCIQCHSDHKGREFESAKVNEKTFDHKLTGYKLEGKHAEIQCSKCHVDKRGDKRTRPDDPSFVGKKTSCTECHKKDDPHQFQGDWAKEDCNKCHGLKSWKKDVRFNHEKDAHFSLVGKHAKVSCKECHLPKDRAEPVYKWNDLKTQQCLSCHKDVHNDRISPKFRGGQCLTCHGQETWKIQKFQHEKITGYAIEGAHLKLDCTKCHTQTAEARSIGKKAFKWTVSAGGDGTCRACHKDPHKENLSPKFREKDCDSCHGNSTWKIKKFEHAKITGYTIEGAHLKLDCTKCHTQSREALASGKKAFKWILPFDKSSSCKSCHKDYHKENLGPKLRAANCDTCHGSSTWKIHAFDHTKSTGYAINGAHMKLDCIKCHVQTKPVQALGRKAFKWVGPGDKCLSCHKDHHGFGKHRSERFPDPTACLKCHNETKWKTVHDFDHNKNTRYEIDGKHKSVSCSKCHLPGKHLAPLAAPTGIYHWENLETKTCENCHRSPHRNTFSPELLKARCTECHVTEGWKIRPKNKVFDHNKLTRFPLTGKHQTTKCEDCHGTGKKQVFRMANSDKQFCVTCHENVHKEQFSPAFRDRSCAECHTTTDFKTRLKFDHGLSRFPLREKHSALKCQECHKPTGLYLKTKPPVPMSKFSFPELGTRNCETCHKDPHHDNFGKACMDCHAEKEWKKTRDFHRNFTLDGVHFSLQCSECHKNDRKLVGMSRNCVMCHQKDDVHNGSLPQCGECHRQQFWEHASFKHSLTSFPLRGIHRTLDCAACHNHGVYRGTPSRCVDCHLNDAPATASGSTPAHAMPGFQSCDQCHNHFTF